MAIDSFYEIGEAGVINETGATAVTPPAGKYFAAIQILDDANFSLLTDASAVAGSDALTGRTILAGIILFGRFSAFTLASGAVRAYLRKEKN